MTDKVQNVRDLIKAVCNQSAGDQVPIKELEDGLVQIKESGRDSEVSLGLTIDDLHMLIASFVVQTKSHKALIEAFTIIANALVLNQQLLDVLDPHLLSSKVLNECFQPQVEPKERYLFMRLMFLMTFKGVEYEDKALKTCLTIIATEISSVKSQGCQFTDDGMERLIFIECMKLTFNLLHHYTTKSVQYIQGYTAQDLVTIYYTLDPMNPLNNDLHQYISNVLLCIPVSMWLYEAEDPPSVLNHILSFLEVMVNPNNDPETRQDRILAPPLSLVHCIVMDLKDYKVEETDDSSEGSPDRHHHHHIHRHIHIHRHRRSSSQGSEPKSVRLDSEKREQLIQVCRSRLLPSPRDREQPLGKSDSVSSYLLQITIDPVLRTSRNIIFDLFWKVSNESAEEFVANFGLGFASSFLASHGIAFPDSVSTDSPTEDQLRQRLKEVKRPINPITGQYLDQQKPPSPEEEMTEEEKLRDAERLFVLFERLKANNMIKVENPVEVAARNGELEKY